MFIFVTILVLQDIRSMKMAMLDGWQLQCLNTTCSPFATVSVASVTRCQMACLARDQCQGASFRQSTTTCQLFSNSFYQNETLIVDADTVTMLVASETRLGSGKLDLPFKIYYFKRYIILI